MAKKSKVKGRAKRHGKGLNVSQTKAVRSYGGLNAANGAVNSRSAGGLSKVEKARELSSLLSTFKNSGRFEKALPICDQILDLIPNDFEALASKGLCYYFLGDFERAAEAYDMAMRIDENNYVLCLNYSSVFYETGDFNSALKMLDRCIKINPKGVVAYNNMGNALGSINAPHEVVLAHYQKAIKLDPTYSDGYINASNYFSQLGDRGRAHQMLALGLKYNPQHVGLLSLYGQSAQGIKDVAKSKAAFETLIEIKPDSALALLRLMSFAKQECDWEQVGHYKSRFLRSLEGASSGEIKVATVNTLANHVGPFELLSAGISHDVVKKATEFYVATRQRACVYNGVFKVPELTGKIKVGYVSPDFNAHAVGFLLNNIFSFHDRERFEIYGYYLNTLQDSQTETIRTSCDHFAEVAGKNFQEIASQINEDGIHILVDLAGYTNGAKPGIFDLKPAPVQCHYIGYPGTLASDKVDYLITLSNYMTADIAVHFTEKMAYLPEVALAAPPPAFDEAVVPSKAEIGLPEDKFVFFCFSAHYRIDRQTFDAWLEVLKRAEDSVLWMFSENTATENRLLSYASEQGVDPERIIFTKRERMTKRGIHQRGDLLLDALTLTSGTAGAISLSTATPMLTCSGTSLQSRTGAAVLMGMGMHELICQNVAEFVDKAVYLATNRDDYLAIKNKLKTKLPDAPLFDQQRCVRHLETAFEMMMDRYAKGEAPADIVVSPLPKMSCGNLLNEE